MVVVIDYFPWFKSGSWNRRGEFVVVIVGFENIPNEKPMFGNSHVHRMLPFMVTPMTNNNDPMG